MKYCENCEKKIDIEKDVCNYCSSKLVNYHDAIVKPFSKNSAHIIMPKTFLGKHVRVKET